MNTNPNTRNISYSGVLLETKTISFDSVERIVVFPHTFFLVVRMANLPTPLPIA